jgi:hypothetical protein
MSNSHEQSMETHTMTQDQRVLSRDTEEGEIIGDIVQNENISTKKETEKDEAKPLEMATFAEDVPCGSQTDGNRNLLINSNSMDIDLPMVKNKVDSSLITETMAIGVRGGTGVGNEEGVEDGTAVEAAVGTDVRNEVGVVVAACGTTLRGNKASIYGPLETEINLILRDFSTHPLLDLHDSSTHPLLCLHDSSTHPLLGLHDSSTHPLDSSIDRAILNSTITPSETLKEARPDLDATSNTYPFAQSVLYITSTPTSPIAAMIDKGTDPTEADSNHTLTSLTLTLVDLTNTVGSTSELAPSTASVDGNRSKASNSDCTPVSISRSVSSSLQSGSPSKIGDKTASTNESNSNGKMCHIKDSKSNPAFKLKESTKTCYLNKDTIGDKTASAITINSNSKICQIKYSNPATKITEDIRSGDLRGVPRPDIIPLSAKHRICVIPPFIPRPVPPSVPSSVPSSRSRPVPRPVPPFVPSSVPRSENKAVYTINNVRKDVPKINPPSQKQVQADNERRERTLALSRLGLNIKKKAM